MDEQKARSILREHLFTDSNGSQYLSGGFDFVVRVNEDGEITLDGRFPLDKLEAIVWWLKHNPTTYA